MFLLFVAVIFVSCEGKKQQESHRGSDSPAPSETATTDIRTVQLDISGMTCEIGCAKLIQSKLYKTEGVSFAEVSFADSTGVVRYDANRLTENDLRAVVEGAGGGDLYRVQKISQVENAEDQEDKSDISQ